MKKFLIILTGLLIVGLAWSAEARPLREQKKIDYLMHEVGTSGFVFIRNNTEYNSKEAEAHLQEKLDYAGERVTTAEEFIHYIATGSSVSGEPYYVIFPDGQKMETAEWLQNKLSKLHETVR